MRELQSTTLKLPLSWWSPWPSGPDERLKVYWSLLAVSIVSFLLDYILENRVPMLRPALQIVGMVPCGFCWLFARALFRPTTRTEVWPEVIVGVLFVSCLIRYVDPSGHDSGLMRYVGEFQGLLGSAVLLLTFIEALDGKTSTQKERRFRFVFAGGHAALIATAFAFALPELVGWQSGAHATLAVLALMGATLAWQYRLKNPIPGARSASARVAKNPALARSIRHLLEDGQAFLDPQIKVAGVAATLGQPDYKVSQCVVNDLGFRNFNQLVNSYRLDMAKRRLAHLEHADESILVIALDCGFGSVGPFNRAFKAQTGVTPSAYRRAALGA